MERLTSEQKLILNLSGTSIQGNGLAILKKSGRGKQVLLNGSWDHAIKFKFCIPLSSDVVFSAGTQANFN